MKLNSELVKQLVAPVLALCLAICLFCLGYQCSRKQEPIESEKIVTTVQRDTVWKSKTVSVPHPVPVTKTITKTVHDTLPVTQIIHSHSTDTVYAQVDIPVTTSKYAGEKTLSDSTTVSYDAVVSGYKPSLDSLSFRVRYPQINTSTVTTTTSVKRKHFGVGVSVGAGFGIINRKPDIFIGLSAVYLF